MLLALAGPLLSCGPPKRDFSPLGPVTQADLWITASDGSKYIWKVSDPKDLARIVSYVDSQRTNWGAPWFGVPVPMVEVRMFDGQQARGSFGSGKNFFETQRDGGSYSKKATASEIQSFFDALNLNEERLKEYTK